MQSHRFIFLERTDPIISGGNFAAYDSWKGDKRQSTNMFS